MAAGEVKTGKVEWAGLDLTAKRSSKEYKQLLDVLDRYDVGAAKGAADRSIVADTFFSQTEPGVVPQFATGDPGIYNSMLRIKGINPAKLGKPVPAAFPAGFDVTTNGRTVKVIPLPKK